MKRFADLVIRVVVPVAVAITLFSVFVTEQIEIDYDLQVTAPRQARPGASVPIRALLIGHLNRIEGPEFVIRPTFAKLFDAAGRTVASTRLRPSYRKTMEGLLVTPRGARGPAEIQVIAELPDESVTVTLPFKLVNNPPRLLVQNRRLGPLNQFSSGPVHAVGQEQPPSALEVRVVGGVCVPEQRCDLLIRVGAPPASIEIAKTASVTRVGGRSTPSEETDGIIEFSVITHGPEADLRLLALRDSKVVAKRAIRLPVDLATTSLRLDKRIINESEKPRFVLEDKQEESGCIVDIFYENRWVSTYGSKDCTSEKSLRFPPNREMSAGLWRVQARRDPFGSRTSAVRVFYLRHAEQSDTDVLRAIAQSVSVNHPDDEYAQQVAVRPGHYIVHGLQQQAAFLFAGDEAGLAAQPKAITSYPETQARLQRYRNKLRRFSLVALTLTGITLGLLIARRGLRAASTAREIMSAAGDSRALTRRNRLLMTLTIFAVVAALLLTFVAIAIYIIARENAV